MVKSTLFNLISFLELWINGKLTDYAQAATKQNRIIPGGPTTDAEESIPETMKPSKGNQKKDSVQREVKDSAAQAPSYVIISFQII